MPTPVTTLQLDEALDLSLTSYMRHESMLGRYDAHGDKVLVVRAADESSLYSELKEKLSPYIDFDTGGLKVISTRIGGSEVHLSVVPSWDSMPMGLHSQTGSHGGPALALHLDVHF